jgi:hypothetical protein
MLTNADVQRLKRELEEAAARNAEVGEQAEAAAAAASAATAQVFAAANTCSLSRY